LYIIIGIVGILVVLIAIIFGYSIIKKGGESAFGLLPSTPSHTVDALNMTVSTPKNTPTLTKTSGPTPTSWPTFTPFKSFTPRPTKTLTPNPISFDNSPKTIEGQVLISGDKSSNFPIITIYDVYAATKIGYSVSSNGKIFVVIRNRLENSGGMGEYSNIYWTALGSNGVFIDPYTASGIDCALGWDVTVIDGGTLDSCIVFEVPTHSKFTVMFVPFSYDRFNPERSLQWEITLP
jgi:hypothetical protein